jgi:hypothetical protein
MTKETIIENCQRLKDFYRETIGTNESMMKDIPISPEGLLYCYGRILDYNGAWKSGMSLLFLDEGEYNEMKAFTKTFDGFKDSDILSAEATKKVKTEVHPEAAAWCNWFGFNHYGYHWVVKKK